MTEGDIFDQKVTLASDKRKKNFFLMQQIDDACDSTFFDDFLEVRKRGSKRQSWLEEVGREALHRMHDRRGEGGTEAEEWSRQTLHRQHQHSIVAYIIILRKQVSSIT